MKKQRKTESEEKRVFTELLCAAQEGENSIETVKKLLETGADPNYKPESENCETPLHAAAASGSIPLVKLLLKYGADVNCMRNDQSPLETAIENGKLPMIKFLLKAGADVNAGGNKTPLMRAVDGDRMDIVRALLDAGADVNTVTSSGTAHKSGLEREHALLQDDSCRRSRHERLGAALHNS